MDWVPQGQQAEVGWKRIARTDPNIQRWYDELRTQYPDEPEDVVEHMENSIANYNQGSQQGYDYGTAIMRGLRPGISQEDGKHHWYGDVDGIVVKGEKHPTRHLTDQGMKDSVDNDVAKLNAMREPMSKGQWMGLALGGAVTGAALVKYAGGPMGTRIKSIDHMKNYLRGFYGGRILDKPVAAGKEALAGSVEIVRNIASPEVSYAHDKTGLSPRTYKTILEQERQLNTLRKKGDGLLKQLNDSKKVSDPKLQAEFKKNSRLIAHIQKQQHYKLINDYSNRFLFNNKGIEATDDVARYAQKFVTKISNPADAQKYFGGNKDVMKMVVKSQGIFNQRHALYLLHKNPPKAGDVLRGIQFDKKVYNFFIGANEKGLENLTPTSYKNAVKAAGLKSELINGKYYFKLSPNIKGNYDWGGYQGIVEWNPKKRNSVTFYANDKRDLFKMKFGGRDVVNVVQPKEIAIPKIVADIQDELPPKRQAEIVKKIVGSNAPRTKKLVASVWSPGNNIAHAKEITKMLSIHEEALKAKVPKRKLLSFVTKRLGGLGAGISAIAFLTLAYQLYRENKAKPRDYSNITGGGLFASNDRGDRKQ